MTSILVDNEAKVRVLCSLVAERTNKNDSILFLDLEGVNLGRNGTVAIMQLMLPPCPVVYLIDVHVLGGNAFTISADDTLNLKSILESDSIHKVFFDIRNDSDALYAHFDIKVAGIIDLQLLEYATRAQRRGYLSGLAKCIAKDLPYNHERSAIKERGRRLFAPEVGGKYEVFEERPLAEDIITYCEQDVLVMPDLLSRYSQKLEAGRAVQVQEFTMARVQLSQSESFNGKGQHMAVAPAFQSSGFYQNAQLSPQMSLVCSSKIANLCRLDDATVQEVRARFDAL